MFYILHVIVSLNVLPGGQSSILHSTTLADFPVQVPPLSSTTSFSLVLVFVPVPQLTEQSPTLHSPHWQLITMIKICHHWFRTSEYTLTHYDITKIRKIVLPVVDVVGVVDVLVDVAVVVVVVAEIIVKI